MLELIGMLAIWLAGLGASFYIPLVLTLRRGGGLEIIALSLHVGAACVAVYIVASMIYLAAT